ncbi:MAG: hypothetical protein LBE10_07160 [Treponema sp.]|jgi:hypothetical protein|nr:hypothetical protein [Treponema sp.]
MRISLRVHNKTYAILFMMNILFCIYAEGEREHLDSDYLHLKIINLTNNNVNIYINNNIPVFVKKDGAHTTEKIAFSGMSYGPIFIEYETGEIKLLEFRDVDHWFNVVHSFQIVIFQNDIKIINAISSDIDKEYNYFDESIYNSFYWQISGNDIYVKIKIINDSNVKKIVKIKQEKELFEIELNILEEYVYEIKSAFILAFYFELNIRDYNKSFNGKDNIELSVGNYEVLITLNKTGFIISSGNYSKQYK